MREYFGNHKATTVMLAQKIEVNEINKVWKGVKNIRTDAF